MIIQRRNDIMTFNERYDPGDVGARTATRHIRMIRSSNRPNCHHAVGSRGSSWRTKQHCLSEPVSRDHARSPALGNNPHSASGTT